MFKKERGYKPWVARKPPILTKSLNTTYIKVSTALGWSIPVFLVGVLIGPTITSYVFEQINTKQSRGEPVIAPLPAKIIQKNTFNNNPQTLANPPVTETPAIVVPAIPMTSEAPQTNTMAKADEVLKRDYALSTYDAIILIKSAKESSAKTGIDPSILLALAAKITQFNPMYQGKYIGVLNVRPELHKAEAQKLKNDNLSATTFEGSFRLGAEVLATYKTESNGDINVALERFIKMHNVSAPTSTAEVIALREILSNL